MPQKINLSNLPYLIIGILLIIIILQNRSCTSIKKPQEKQIDTVFVDRIVKIEIPGKPIPGKSTDNKGWINKHDFVPKSTYDSLKDQYIKLGNLYFRSNTFETKFNIENYGYVVVKDTISENWLNSTKLTTFLTIPEKTITIIEKEREKPKRQLYIGGSITGNPVLPINGAYGGLILKDKKDHLYGGAVGYNGTINYKFSMYWPIFKK